MSFLNPVNEPVLRFSSTDADAPQINYAARTAGDIKAVLKACLVTGYGAKASAGWSVVNEVDHVCEFISPSAAMSDYRLGIDDSTATKTDWYYQYQDVRVNPAYNAPVKKFTNINEVNPENGWQLFVTERGILFVEIVQHSNISKLSTRITYWGAVKSGISSVNGKNICFFNIGHNATTGQPYNFYSATNYVHVMLESNKSAFMSAATSNALSKVTYDVDISNVDLVSPIYIATASFDMLIGELPPILSKVVNSTADIYGISNTTLGVRPVFIACAGFSNTMSENTIRMSRTFLIKTDYWEY